jgi:hypothetical protein
MGEAMRPILAVRMALILVLITLSGCTAHTPGSPGRAVPDYPGFLGTRIESKLTYLDNLRTIDPCGYLDPVALARIAHPSYLGADGEFNSCTATFHPAAGVKRIGKVEFGMGMIPEPGYGTPVDVNGTTIHISDAGEFCSAHLQFDDKQTVAVRVHTAPLADRADLCPEAIDLAEATIPLLRTRPLRSGSHHANVDTRLSRLDPCSVLRTLGQDRPNLDAGELNPWGCWFRLDAYDESTEQRIAFLYASDAHLYATMKGDELVEIDGFPARSRPGAGRYAQSCEMSVGVDAQRADPAQNPLTRLHRSIELIRVNVSGGGCANAEATATELVRLYKLSD